MSDKSYTRWVSNPVLKLQKKQKQKTEPEQGWTVGSNQSSNTKL